MCILDGVLPFPVPWKMVPWWRGHWQTQEPKKQEHVVRAQSLAKRRRFPHREDPAKTRGEGREGREGHALLEGWRRTRQREKRLAKRADATPTRAQRHEEPAMERRESAAPVEASEQTSGPY